jgi:2-keto-3-deoxy-L-rhamnonate aldolase RhmA
LKGIRSQNRLKSQLRQGLPAFGLTLAIGHPEVSYALGTVGLDWINYDMQHTVMDVQTVAAMIQAMSYSQTVPIVRVPSNDLAIVNKALDFGACGVIVPLVNSREDAEKAVRFSRYGPKGTRSWGQRAALRDPEYATTADTEIMVIPQIETGLAVQNLEAIVCTEGIEAVFCGPYDLSMSLGVFRQFDNPKFVKALETIVSTCKAHDVSPGILAPIGPIEKTLQLGFKLITLGGDLPMLTGSVAKALEKARSAADSL